MLDSNLRERAEKKVTLDMTTKATEQFIKFLYGFKLADDLDIDIIKELMEYGQMYLIDSLQKASGKKLDVLEKTMSLSSCNFSRTKKIILEWTLALTLCQKNSIRDFSWKRVISTITQKYAGRSWKTK